MVDNLAYIVTTEDPLWSRCSSLDKMTVEKNIHFSGAITYKCVDTSHDKPMQTKITAFLGLRILVKYSTDL